MGAQMGAGGLSPPPEPPHFNHWLRPVVLELGSGTGQTDDGHHFIMPHPIGAGHNKVLVVAVFHHCLHL